jgi:ribonuclease M5
MKKIREVIVVEGKNDTANLKRFFDCDTIETHGTCLSSFTLELIRHAKEKRGVIILTDPDSPGNRIRNEINRKIPGCLNAFVDKADAKTEHKVGVEHAGEETLKQALDHLMTYTETVQEITPADLYEMGLLGSAESAVLREKVGRKLHIGSGNARTFRQRLNCLQITKEEIWNIIRQ